MAIGQQLAAGSVPVVLPAAQITALTPPNTITVTQATGSSLHAVVDSGTITTVGAVTAITNALPAGANTIGNVGVVAGSAIVGKVGIDQTTPGTTNLVQLPASQITTLTPPSTVAVTQATGTNLHAVIDSGTITTVSAVTAISNALPAGANIIGKFTTDQTTHGTTDLVAADITKVAGAPISQGHGTAATAVRVELPTDGTGLVGSQLSDGVTPANKATVAQFHNADNQSPGGTAYGLLTGGVAQTLNAAGNLDRQRSAGSDQVPMRGIITGSATFVQEILATSTTSVTAAAATATLGVANTAGFLVGGTCNLEPSFTNVMGAKYEAATITAVVANTSVTVSFPTGGALYAHTQPYTIQTFLGNQERDFSGEQQSAQGIGAAIATEFESNSGGPPLATGLPSGWTLDADRNVQGKNNQQMAITSTVAADASLAFTGNPWTSGLVVGQSIILSATANGAAVETVIVSKNNTPAAGAGPTTVKIVNPVVTTASTFASLFLIIFNFYGNHLLYLPNHQHWVNRLFNIGSATSS